MTASISVSEAPLGKTESRHDGLRTTEIAEDLAGNEALEVRSESCQVADQRHFARNALELAVRDSLGHATGPSLSSAMGCQRTEPQLSCHDTPKRSLTQANSALEHFRLRRTHILS